MYATDAKFSLGSDNHSGVHPDIMQAMLAVNGGHVPAYGTDKVTQRAKDMFMAMFGACEVFFVFNGTAANVLGLYPIRPAHGTVICADVAHINVDECAAPEAMTGAKLQPVVTLDGRLNVDQIKPLLIRRGDQHMAQPSVLSLTQATECGTVYSPEALAHLCAKAHQHGARNSDRRAKAGCAFEECAETKSDEQQLQTPVSSDAANRLLQDFKPAFFNSQAIQKNDVENDPAYRENAGYSAINGGADGDTCWHGENKNCNQQADNYRYECSDMRLHLARSNQP